MSAIKKDSWVLVPANGRPVSVGDTVFDFRGDVHRAEGGTPPHKPGSSGRMITSCGEFFPSVFDGKWVQR